MMEDLDDDPYQYDFIILDPMTTLEQTLAAGAAAAKQDTEDTTQKGQSKEPHKSTTKDKSKTAADKLPNTPATTPTKGALGGTAPATATAVAQAMFGKKPRAHGDVQMDSSDDHSVDSVSTFGSKRKINKTSNLFLPDHEPNLPTGTTMTTQELAEEQLAMTSTLNDSPPVSSKPNTLRTSTRKGKGTLQLASNRKAAPVGSKPLKERRQSTPTRRSKRVSRKAVNQSSSPSSSSSVAAEPTATAK